MSSAHFHKYRWDLLLNVYSHSMNNSKASHGVLGQNCTMYLSVMLSWSVQPSPESSFKSSTSVSLKGLLLERVYHNEDSQGVFCLLHSPRSTVVSVGMCVPVGLDSRVILQQVTARGFGLCAAWAAAAGLLIFSQMRMPPGKL